MCRKGLLPKHIFEFRNNIKSTWKILNEITKRINKTNNSPSSEFVKDHKMITDDKEIYANHSMIILEMLDRL